MTRALAALTLSGVASLIIAAYLWGGVIAALILYGAFAVAGGLLIDSGSKAKD